MRENVAEELVDGEAEVGLLPIFCDDDAVKTFDERFGRDVFVAIQRSKIDRESRTSGIVLVAVLVQPIKLRVLSAMDDRIFREFASVFFWTTGLAAS